MEKFNLTEKQKQVFDYIKKHFDEAGTMPMHKDIAAKFDVSMPTIAKHLMAIERRGWIKRAKGLKNGMTILD
jgi:repressor LexA